MSCCILLFFNCELCLFLSLRVRFVLAPLSAGALCLAGRLLGAGSVAFSFPRPHAGGCPKGGRPLGLLPLAVAFLFAF